MRLWTLPICGGRVVSDSTDLISESRIFVWTGLETDCISSQFSCSLRQGRISRCGAVWSLRARYLSVFGLSRNAQLELVVNRPNVLTLAERRFGSPIWVWRCKFLRGCLASGKKNLYPSKSQTYMLFLTSYSSNNVGVCSAWHGEFCALLATV